jgi:nucleoside-diphosphate-sugar epimerase
LIRGLVAPTALIEFDDSGGRSREQERRADAEDTYRRIGWRARVPLEEGLSRTVEQVRLLLRS